LWFAGVDTKKVNVGIPYYGRGYTVKDKNCMHTGCDQKGGNKQAACSEYDGDGFMSNNAIRGIIQEKGLKPKLIRDAAQKEITWDDQWVAFDDEETVKLKTEWANTNCLGGLMVWSVCFDGPSVSRARTLPLF
jgi:chitinase